MLKNINITFYIAMFSNKKTLLSFYFKDPEVNQDKQLIKALKNERAELREEVLDLR